MKFKAHAVVKGEPELSLRCVGAPILFDVGAHGAVDVQLGPIKAQVERVPISLAIPFLNRGNGVQTIGAIGPFGVSVEAIHAKLTSVDAKLFGVLGKEGLECTLEGRVGCKTELDVVGHVPGRVAKASVEMMEGEPDEEDE
jgi:hypothetical protein